MPNDRFRLIAAIEPATDALDAAIAARPDAILLCETGGDATRRVRDAGLPVWLDVDADRTDASIPSPGEIAGYRLVPTGGVDPARLAPLIAAARSALPKAELLAGPVGGGSVRALRQAGVDRLVTAFGWWDLSAPWLLDELEAARGLLPVAAEFRREQLHGSDEPARIARLLSVAAALSDTLIVPASVFADASLVQRVRTIGQAALGYRGAVRRLSDPQAGVTVLLRGDTGDLRAATAATLLLVNRADEPVDAPDAASLLAVAGVGLRAIARAGGRGDPFVPLGPGEVRLLTARVARPIASAVKPGGKAARAFAEECPRIVVEQVAPSVSGGAFAVKRVVGETVEVEALVYADGHEQLAAELLWRAYDDKGWTAVPLTFEGNDLWTASFTPTRMGRHEFVVEAWLDRFGGFRRDFAKKLEAGVAQPVDYMEGRALVAEAAARAGALADWPARLEAAGDGEEGTALLLSPELASAMAVADDRRHRTRSSVQLLDAERLEARFSSWYELFPRSMSGTKDRHGTFRDVINHLPRVRDMGFDTLYFPPIHPIGTANRKGPNNTLTPAEGDPGSPYAIGSADGGHDAIHPELGTFEDFRALIAAARAEGLEIAIDFAIQCSPDHPWLKEHPGWFAWRPDGSMKYAENPPKKYQDIVNVDFYAPDAVPALWCALRDIVLLWAREGIRTFRVDNPHTKPLPFWQWMIGEVRRQYPDAIFLAEAFTRPAMMYRLAKIGFSQSYTYFTWRDDKAELIEYIEELTTTAPREFYRPHFFVNTPDINPVYLQTSGRPGFRVRAVLAATLSGLFGVYSGFELCEAAPLPGKEEYLDSEKYELRPRDWNAPGNIVADITLLNRLRRANPALQTHLNTRFYSATNDAIIYYGKPEPSGTGMILVMVNLDPHNGRECEFDVPLWEFGLPDEGSVSVEDMARGYRFDWHGKRQFIRLDPDEPYRIWRIAPKENSA